MSHEYEDQIAAFSESWEAILDDEDHPDYELACEISNWITWLWVKPRELATMDEELAEVKFAAWREMLDLHLWSEPKSLQEVLAAKMPEQTQEYLDFFKECQGLARQSMVDQGYERICPTEGALLVPGEAIAATNRVQPTEREELDGRVFKVLSGHAGYRKGGKVLAPATAITYKYLPAES